MHLAIGPMVRLFTRNIYRQVEARETWYNPITLTTESKSEFLFWEKNLSQINSYSFKPNPVTTNMLFTVASERGYGGFSCTRFSKKLCSGRFTPDKILTSSTNRELLAVRYVLESFGKFGVWRSNPTKY